MAKWTLPASRQCGLRSLEPCSTRRGGVAERKLWTLDGGHLRELPHPAPMGAEGAREAGGVSWPRVEDKSISYLAGLARGRESEACDRPREWSI